MIATINVLRQFHHLFWLLDTMPPLHLELSCVFFGNFFTRTIMTTLALLNLIVILRCVIAHDLRGILVERVPSATPQSEFCALCAADKNITYSM